MLYKTGYHTYISVSRNRSAAMSDGNFTDYITRERDRLSRERETVFNQQQELEKKLGEINREFAAIEAYEAAKTGKAVSRPASGRGSGRPRQARRGSRREELMNVIREGGGLSRGEILSKMGLKGDKTGEMSVSNALTALTKGNQVRRDAGKYHIA
jgi:hypothetical protein